MQRYTFFFTKMSDCSKIYFHAVEFKQAALPHLPDLPRVKELYFAGAFVVVVLDGDAASPFLDLAGASP